MSILLLLPLPVWSEREHDTPGVVPWRKECSLANQAVNNGDYASAETHYQQALSGMNAATAYQKATTTQELGNTKYRLRKYAEAVRLFESCTAELEKSANKDPDGFSFNLEMLSRTYRHLGRTDEALSTGIRALHFAERTYGKGSSAYGFASRNLGKLYLEMKRPSDAEAAFRQALKNFDSSNEVKDPNIVGGCLMLLLESVQMQGKEKQAELPPIKARIHALEQKLGTTF